MKFLYAMYRHIRLTILGAMWRWCIWRWSERLPCRRRRPWWQCRILRRCRPWLWSRTVWKHCWCLGMSTYMEPGCPHQSLYPGPTVSRMQPMFSGCTILGQRCTSRTYHWRRHGDGRHDSTTLAEQFLWTTRLAVFFWTHCMLSLPETASTS
jgi:hypothetical protein